MYNKSISELAKGLIKKDFSSVELTQVFLNRAKQYNALNAYVTITEEFSLQYARASDLKLERGQAGLLTGIPLGQKDIFCTEGIKTTCGSKMLDNFLAPYNATVVEKLTEAGTVMLGKLNMDEFAMGSSNENSYYGAVKNPWDTRSVAGGSSGGSAAAIAARLAVCATGTDTGGSIRQPSSHCGITGLKPTYGRVSRYGMIAYASSLDQGGPMARSAEDAAILLQAMSGFDPKDSTSVDRSVPNYLASLNNDIAGLTIGLPKEFFGEGLDASVAAVIDTAIKEYQKLGAHIKEISIPNLNLAIPAYYVIASAECSANLSRFDGVRFGYRCKDPVDLTDLYVRSRGEAFGREVKRRILMGTYALSAGYYDAYYLKAQKVRRLITEDFKRALCDVDVIMGPVAPTVAFAIGEKIDNPIEMYLSDIYTIAINLAGLPALSVPAGFANNKPVGLQIIGDYFAEDRLLNIAHQYQKVTGWHQQIPLGFD